MSCFPESVYSVYVDGELAPQEVRDVETHLVGCRDCRALVLGLREEGTLLADLLLERVHPAHQRSARPAPAGKPPCNGATSSIGASTRRPSSWAAAGCPRRWI